MSAICGVTLVAQVRIDGGGTAINELPVDVLLLAYAPQPGKFSIERVPANSQRPTSASTLLSIEPVASDIGRRESPPACSGGLEPDVASTRQLVEQLRAIDFLNTPSARERIELASSLAQLELEQRTDLKETYRNDPLRAELKFQEDRDAGPKSVLQTIQDRTAEREQAASEFASDAADLALAWSSVQQERLSILHDELKTFEPLVKQAQLAYRIKQDEFARYERSVAEWQSYSAAVAAAVDHVALRAADKAPLLTAGPRRMCAGPSGPWDVIEVEAEAPRELRLAAMIVEGAFDRGGKQVAVLRHVTGTSRWVGRLDWPAPATSVRLRARWPGGVKWADAQASIRTGRMSAAESLRQAASAMSEIEKKMKESNFRAAGGDHIKTVPVF